MSVYTTPADLTAALVAKAKGYDFVAPAPSIEEQLTSLLRPGHAVGIRTESGSFYEANCYSTGEVTLIRVLEETDRVHTVAKGKLAVARKHGRCGLIVTEPSGRTFSTSAIVKAWLAYDANRNESHPEPA